MNIKILNTEKHSLVAIVMGNIGTGKTTFIRSLNARESRIIIINDDYPDVNSNNLSNDIFEALHDKKTVVLEGNYVSRHIRGQVINPIKSHLKNVKFICFDFGPGNKETLERRLLNPDYDKEKTVDIHNKYLRRYNKPSIREGFHRIINCY